MQKIAEWQKGKVYEMAVNIPGLSTLGVKLGFAVETTANTKPAAFTWLERVNSISGIELPSEQIDRR